MKIRGLFVIAITALFLFEQMIAAQTTETTKEFIKAVTAGETATVSTMLKADPKLAAAKTEKGVSAILMAVYYSKPEVIRILENSGLELDVFEASALGRTDRVIALATKDKKLVNSYSADGFLPLGLAIFFGHDQTALALLEAGAEVNLASKETMRVTPLHSAVAAKRIEIARKLVEHGAKVNATGENDFTPLHEAAATGQLEFAKLLVDSGADVNAKTSDGNTPLSYAVSKKQPVMEAYLRKHGAKQ